MCFISTLLLVYGQLIHKIHFSSFPLAGNNKTPESAAFPNGLPEALEASVARYPADGVSSDSDHGGMPLLRGNLQPMWTLLTSTY